MPRDLTLLFADALGDMASSRLDRRSFDEGVAFAARVLRVLAQDMRNNADDPGNAQHIFAAISDANADALDRFRQAL